jgi:hypothetical protein
MANESKPARMTPVCGSWWAAYEDASRHFVVPIVCFDDHGAPYVWSAETHGLVSAVRTSFIGVVSDDYRGEYGELVAAAIKSANAGHRGEAHPSHDDHATSDHAGSDTKDKLREGIDKARDVIHDATSPDR